MLRILSQWPGTYLTDITLDSSLSSGRWQEKYWDKNEDLIGLVFLRVDLI